jgi:lipopolysaccharide exporter
MATGSIWIMAARWAMRLIGVVSTVILARLLSPHDFGIVAMAMLAVGLLQAFSESGQRLALIRLKTVTRGHYDTAWTIGVIVGVIVAIALVLLGPLVASYFKEPQLVVLLAVLAIKPLIGGLENIGTVDFRRDLRFDIEFKFLFWPKIVSFVATVGCALIWPNYWALVAGILVGQIANLVLSYTLHRYRPRLSLAKLRELWSFSYWTLAHSIAGYGAQKTDEIVVGRLFATSELGMYSVVGSVATMPVEELILPPGRALYSGFSQLQDDKPALRKMYFDAMSVLFTLACAASVGVTAVAHDMVLVLLGAKWLDGVPLVPWLTLAAALLAISYSNNMLLVVLGKAKWVAIRSWLFLIALVSAMLIGQYYAGLVGVAMGRGIATVLLFAIMQVVVCRLLGIRLAAVIALYWRPLIAAAAMYSVIQYGGVSQYLGIADPVIRLMLNVALGALLFAGIQMLLWRLAGRPTGVESYALSISKAAMRKVCRR